ncbi:MAG TPA: RNA polymerase factor sigma-54, partial [Alphaproteobacteria bacterium]|nr:RNA polymerase factor sigma-54 [Alphaproteobacteria bacterium]
MSVATLHPRLEMRQGQSMMQSLVMTPQLQQAIKLLQMSNQELATYLESEMEQNPLLERADSEGSLEKDEAPAAEAAEESTDDNAAEWQERSGAGDGYEAPEWNLSAQSRGPGWDGGLDGEGPATQVSETVNLREHLLRQMQLDVQDAPSRLIALTLLDHLDEAGYMQGDVNVIAKQLGAEPAKVEAVLQQLQRLEPAGIFARNLKECLAIQLRDKGRFDPAMQTLVEHLDLLAAREREKLMKLCGVDAEDFAEMVAEIRALNPKPGLAFDHDAAPTVIPDILMRANASGGWVLELNQETLPRVLINRQYLSQVQGHIVRKTERDFITDKLQSANWLMKALHQRANTILKVATEIVRQQEMFFQYGVEFLKPMTLRDIAAVIGMHESTVSRVTANKYIATSRGLFELKYFFSVSIQGCAGLSAHSAESVRHRIKALIEGEPSGGVLSDDGIVRLLKREGVDIARRTVAKYRES